jgi:hypothetical protein
MFSLPLAAQSKKDQTRLFNSPFGLAFESFIPVDTVHQAVRAMERDSANYWLQTPKGFYLVYRAGTDTLLFSIPQAKYPDSPYDDVDIWDYRVLSRDTILTKVFFPLFEFNDRFNKPWLKK